MNLGNKSVTSSELRRLFVDFFVQNGHCFAPPSSILPLDDDDSILFTNAGMVQFKDCFSRGVGKDCPNKVSIQPCLRVGGKHNDLDIIGRTTKHHTFFEMLGSFSFGGYFKREAIAYAYQFLTGKLGISRRRLVITLCEDDVESYTVWKQQGVWDGSIKQLPKDEIFWDMGCGVGPCGFCTEIFYDRGENFSVEQDRYLELWNLVFMQYNRSLSGELVPLDLKCIDTGMGLERVLSVLQQVYDNYQTDSFTPIVDCLRKVIVCGDSISADKMQVSLRIIADHVRAIVFIIADGYVSPSNEGRGYVLRRFIRRVILQMKMLKLRQKDVFLQLVHIVINTLGGVYPQLQANKSLVKDILIQEINRFYATLEQGLAILEQERKKLSGDVFSGNVAFKLYDTFGFPVQCTEEILAMYGVKIDMLDYDRALQQQKNKSKGTFVRSFNDKSVTLENLLSEFASDKTEYNY